MGILRVILAISVIWSHMSGPHGVLYLVFGQFTAVRVFFMISGFYMSLIFITKYSKFENGTSLFYSNRALRLYPTYFAALILTTIMHVLADRSNLFLHATNWGFPMIFGILSNISAFGLSLTFHFNSFPMVIGPAWTLAEELYFYLLVPFIIFKRPFLLGFIFVLSLGLRVYFHAKHQELGSTFPINDWNYSFFPTNIAFFLMGYLSYLVYSKIKNYEISRYVCQGQSKFVPSWRSKSVPLGLKNIGY
jgi:peptidoglycan/LPS O-acetylase OafA/YrhL